MRDEERDDSSGQQQRSQDPHGGDLPAPEVGLEHGEEHGDIGVFAGTQNTIRLKNLMIKLQEFMPVGLSPVIVAES